MNNNFRKTSRKLLLLLIGSALLGAGCLYLSSSVYICNKAERIMQSKNIIAINNIDKKYASVNQIKALKKNNITFINLLKSQNSTLIFVKVMLSVYCMFFSCIYFRIWLMLQKIYNNN